MPDRQSTIFADPETEVVEALAQGRRPIRTLGYDAPRDRLIAAGFQPIRLVAPGLAETPRADAVMGSAEMGPRGRRLLEALIAPTHPEVPVVITQADAEQPQIFSALRELGRLGEQVPQHVHFCDLLHIERKASQKYNRTRLAQLDEWLVGLGGKRPDANSLAAANRQLERVRQLLMQLNERRKNGLVPGSTMLDAIATATILSPEAAEGAISRLLSETPDPLGGKRRLFVCGSPQENGALIRVIESNGGMIVGESHSWGMPFVRGLVRPARVESPELLAQRIAEEIAALRVELVLHLSIDGDEAAPWDLAAIKRALPSGVEVAALRCTSSPEDSFRNAIAALLAGGPEPTPDPKAPCPKPARDKPSPLRSRKVLNSTSDVNTWQREWFESVRQKVADGSPFAVVNANAPQEILRALDLPFVVNQWWASIVAAKQQSRRYQGLLRAHAYPADVEAYSAQGLAAQFDHDEENAPWGGLPRPDFIHAVASSDPTFKLFEQWGEECGADCFVYERTIDPRPDLFSDWWDKLPSDWENAVESERIDLLVEEMREVIARIEERTDRRFDPVRFAEVMDLVNEQEEYYRKTRDLVAKTVPSPIGVVDSMPATMVPQWHRGTNWARDAAKAFYEEVQARVDAGLAACPNERVRLMWVGRGLWSEMGFYQKWEESHGAIFVWSMYLALAADGYIRELSGGKDPLRALASRVVCMGDELRMPTWAGPWHVHEAQTHQVDAVVALQDADPFVVRALRSAGFPVLELTADNFNREGEDQIAIEAAITQFIEGPASERAEARHARA